MMIVIVRPRICAIRMPKCRFSAGSRRASRTGKFQLPMDRGAGQVIRMFAFAHEPESRFWLRWRFATGC